MLEFSREANSVVAWGINVLCSLRFSAVDFGFLESPTVPIPNLGGASQDDQGPGPGDRAGDPEEG